ncbi:Alpha/Beta hydrolase protein [Xylariaceae sp. FL0804]|nr:Alpha/Beta hydrolase protein [Xylariaceae sp. FL0804]
MFPLRRISRLPSRRICRAGTVPSQPSAPPALVNNTTLLPLLVPSRRSIRAFHAEGLALAPLVFGGLFVGLWTWKCLVMVVLQNKIIYMPGLPPNARRERIEDHEATCGGVRWREERTRANDGTRLALCVADVDLGGRRKAAEAGAGAVVDVDPDPNPTAGAFYILFFQGNASSIPPRLPDISSALCMLKRRCEPEAMRVRCTMVCLSYRGYWKSRGRPNENGIRLDSAAAVDWISKRHREVFGAEGPRSKIPAGLVLWGQSIGSGVATNLAAEQSMPANLRLDSLLLETPFTSIRAMLEVLYPQRWLPYKYLWPFLRNHLDSWKNLGVMAERYSDPDLRPEVFILQAGKDEIVPAELSQMLYDRCLQVELPVTKKAVAGAFHNDAIFRGEGRRAASDFLFRRIAAAQQK